MTKEVLLSITGLQMTPGEEEDTVEVITAGEYYFRNGKHYLIYDEVMEGFTETTHNVIKFCDDYMELTKKGVTNVHMVFEKNKKNVTYYHTPFGSLLIGIDAGKVEIEEQEDFMCVKVEYALDVNYEHLADCDICIKVKPKGGDSFRLFQ